MRVAYNEAEERVTMASGQDRGEPGFAELLDWLEGRLSEDDAARVAQLVDRAGDDVSLAARWIAIFLDMTKDAVLDDPPPEVRELLVRRFATHRPARGVGDRVRAALVWDSRSQPRLAGARSTAFRSAVDHHLQYRAPALDVAIDVYRLDERTVTVEGQVLPDDPAADSTFSVLLLRDEVEVASAVTDDLGAFELERLPLGAYQLRLIGGGTTVVAKLELDPPDADG
jgi:hypothetical protein